MATDIYAWMKESDPDLYKGLIARQAEQEKLYQGLGGALTQEQLKNTYLADDHHWYVNDNKGKAHQIVGVGGIDANENGWWQPQNFYFAEKWENANKPAFTNAGMMGQYATYNDGGTTLFDKIVQRAPLALAAYLAPAMAGELMAGLSSGSAAGAYGGMDAAAVAGADYGLGATAGGMTAAEAAQLASLTEGAPAVEFGSSALSPATSMSPWDAAKTVYRGANLMERLSGGGTGGGMLSQTPAAVQQYEGTVPALSAYIEKLDKEKKKNARIL